MPDNARLHPRYEVDAYIDVTSQDLILYHRIQNISLGGVCIQTKAIEEVGALVDVVLNFPELHAHMAVRGQVVWANREPPQDVGIRWVDLDEDRRNLLKKYISMVKTRDISMTSAAEALRPVTT